MKHILVELMSELTSLTKEEELDIMISFPIKIFEKGTYLLKEGQVARDCYYVIEGCVREYKLMDGEEKTTGFFTEDHQGAANFNSIANQAPSKYNLVCMEDTIAAVLNVDKEEELYRKHPRFETFCRTGMGKILGERQNELVELTTMKPIQRYQKLQEERPELINRVPQYQIASYLGIKPETLSRIRNKMAKTNT